MRSNEKRYVVTMEMYVYADNDYMARKRAHKLKLSLENRQHSDQVDITEIGEQPFASLTYRKLDDISRPTPSVKEEPLPF